ncbi:hypothetical protein [Delftia phage PhiW-14]|uniref:Uncharacterized protein n=1 Tax=Delftia phage PhiW-14 TaxID=665032 RepID=C9DG51_BPW14|nr:hypothetical protein DP-phiW-14_gp080 [Delftia phage PhiW-14]ACV50102.1 hypothetical protein [Delftia phage PhiW-14]
MLGFGPTNHYALARSLLVRPVESKFLLALLELPNQATKELNKGTPEGVQAATNMCATFFNSIHRTEKSLELFISLSGAPRGASALLKFCGAEPASYDADRLEHIEKIMRGEMYA